MPQPIQGNVFDGQEQPLVGVTVSASSREGAVLDSAPTDAGGHYQIDDVPAGTYTVYVSAPNPEAFVRANNIQVTDARPPENVDFSRDPVQDYLSRIDDTRFAIESPISLEEAQEATTLFSVASLMLAGQPTTNGTSTPTAGRTDVLGVIQLFNGTKDNTFLDRLMVPKTGAFWDRVNPELNDLYRTLDARQSEVTQLANEAKRQFNLGPSNGIAANTDFPTLFKRYVELGSDPLLTLDLKLEAQQPNADRTKLVQADKLLEQLKATILQIVRSLSRYGTVGTHQLNADWAGFEARAMELIATLAQHRVGLGGDIDALSQWAVLSDITGTPRDTAISPYVALARHGHRLLRIAVETYRATEHDLERYDPDHLRNLFQAGNQRDTYFTTRIATDATIIARYPLRTWWGR